MNVRVYINKLFMRVMMKSKDFIFAFVPFCLVPPQKSISATDLDTLGTWAHFRNSIFNQIRCFFYLVLFG